jgi:translation elongation factor EF-G
MIRDRLQARPVVVQVPLGVESSFAGVVDLIENKSLTYADELGTEIVMGSVPPELQAESGGDGYRQEVIITCEAQFPAFNGRVGNECEDAADDRGGNAFHNVGAGARGPHDRN